MKEKILEQALKVFNKKGIQNATIRDIALALNISDGHIRYYFKTKEDILLAVFQNLNNEILKIKDVLTISDDIIENLKRTMENVYTTMYAYNFFFLESLNSLSQFPTLFKQYNDLIQNRRVMFLEIFHSFKENGIFRKELTEHDLSILFELLFIVSEGWIRFHRIQNDSISKNDYEHYCELTLKLLNPYFNQ